MKYNDRIKIYKSIYPYFQRHKKLYAMLGGLKAYQLVLTLVTPVFYMMLVNDVMIGRNITKLWIVVAGYVGIYLLQTLGMVIRKIFYNNLFALLKVKVRQRILSVYTSMEAAKYSRHNIGDLKSRIDADVDVIEKFLNSHILDYIYAIISAVVISCIMLYMNWILALIGFVAVPLSFWFARFMSKKSGEVASEYRETYGQYESFLHSAFQNWKEIKANRLEQDQCDAMKDYWDRLSPLFVKRQVYWFINRGFISFKDFFITRMNLYFVGGLLIINGQMDVGMLLVFMNYYSQFFSNIEQITNSIVELKSDRASIDRVMEILDKPCFVRKRVEIKGDEISFEKVEFRYDREQKPVLKDVDLVIRPREHVAIVGRSGCGKTTLIKLLLGMYRPESGAIWIGGYDMAGLSSESIGRKINAVMQEPYLFNVTIRENLLFAKHSATQNELDNACRMGNIFDFIHTLPLGYDTVIGEKGVKLSGGQKQRLAIARAILLDPDILIFDEATSSLDYENEKMIVSSIKELSAGKTVITVAHRLSTILDADRVVVMDQGAIVGDSSHDMLLKDNAIYHALFAGQMGYLAN